MRRAAWGLVAVIWLVAQPGWAARSASEVCADLARKAQRTLWSSVREAGDAAFCRKSWVPGQMDEFAACAQWNTDRVFANKLKNLWDGLFQKADAEWATWGPRGVASDFEQGTIRGGFKRTYFGAGTAYSKSIIEVAKEGGKAEAFVTVCRLDYDGNVTSSAQKSFANGSDNVGTTLSFTRHSVWLYHWSVTAATSGSRATFSRAATSTFRCVAYGYAVGGAPEVAGVGVTLSDTGNPDGSTGRFEPAARPSELARGA